MAAGEFCCVAGKSWHVCVLAVCIVRDVITINLHQPVIHHKQQQPTRNIPQTATTIRLKIE